MKRAVDVKILNTLLFWQAAAREEEVCRQTAALKKTEYTLGAVKAELERGLQAREAAKARIAGADCCPCALLPMEAAGKCGHLLGICWARVA